MAGPTKRIFKSGQFLFREGEPSRSIFLIKRGTVGIRKTKGSAQVEIARVYTNEVIGEVSFFDRMPRSASAVALTEVEVAEIGFDALDKVYVAIPDYMKTIIASLTDRLRKANETIRRLQKNMVPGSAEAGEKKEGEAKEGEAKEGEAKEGEAKEGEAKEGEANKEEATPEETAAPESPKEDPPTETTATIDEKKPTDPAKK